MRNTKREPKAFRARAREISSALLDIESWASAINICAKGQYIGVFKCLWLWNNKLLLQIYVSKVKILFLKLWASFVNKSKDYDANLSISKHEIHLIAEPPCMTGQPLGY